jgi:hypothetical protein
MAAANQSFTVRIQPTRGDDIEIPNQTMNSQVEVLKGLVALKLNPSGGIHPNTIQLIYRTNRNNYKFLELIEGKLGEYGINFMDPTGLQHHSMISRESAIQQHRLLQMQQQHRSLLSEQQDSNRDDSFAFNDVFENNVDGSASMRIMATLNEFDSAVLSLDVSKNGESFCIGC